MKKVLNATIFSILVLLFTILTSVRVNAAAINGIEMDVYIDANGNATITEIWDTSLSEGTEGYRPYTKLENSIISNFSVSDETGIKYENVLSWNSSDSFEQKAYKSGIKSISNGVELCWGISNYGNKRYILKYNISNFITQYTDKQGIYFNFINLDQAVDKAKVIIRSEQQFSLDNARIWGFGNNGTTTFENGAIVLDSKGSLSSSQYMVVLVRFETNLFNTTNTSSKTFDQVYSSAMSDMKEETNGFIVAFKIIFSLIKLCISYTLAFFLNPLVLSIVIILIIRKKKGLGWFNFGFTPRKKSGRLDFGLYGKIMPSDDKINYWREIPCDKDLNRAYWVAYNYNVVPVNTLREGIIGSILLKWIKEELINVSKTKKGLFNFKDNNYAIDLSKINSASNELENKLLEMLNEASGHNKILEAKEFEKWCNKNHGKIQSWFDTFNTIEQAELEKQGMIVETQETIDGAFGSKKTITTKKVNPQLREDAIQLKGLRKFLLDFSRMPEREYFEVHIWEEYLIYAQLLGIADKVEEQFSKLYPKFNEQTKLNTGITTIAVRNMVSLGYKGYETGRNKAYSRSNSSNDYSGSSRDSGGGGSSYSSGGSSSGGSSGGGFR